MRGESGQDAFRDKVAIVTGGASGIGRALASELARRGARVTLGDLCGDGAHQAAEAIQATGGKAHGARVDVAQAQEVQALVDATHREHGRLDYMFNNAGIALGGEVRDMDVTHWRRILDVNLWGVIYGTLAAYDIMTRQGCGHIVNTASLGGLIPEPMATAYATTKHAVVGLSTSLRAEGAALGVRVSVLCPGFVQTGIHQRSTFVGLEREAAIAEISGLQGIAVADFARIALRGVERNKALITDTLVTRWLWWLYRVRPGLLDPFLRKGVQDMRPLRTLTSS
jgi:NAD(P)-dependent dehydrogenase (short-subunit alcohol dehydrogenase family)